MADVSMTDVCDHGSLQMFCLTCTLAEANVTIAMHVERESKWIALCERAVRARSTPVCHLGMWVADFEKLARGRDE